MRKPIIIVITIAENDEYFTSNPNIKSVQTNTKLHDITKLHVTGKFADHNTLITQNGKVYVWGRNYEGQLGIGDRQKIKTPTKNSKLEQIIQENGGVDNILTLKTGDRHNILIFRNGKVYVWGANGDGQLGIGDWWNRVTPTENSELEQIIQENGGVDNILTLKIGGDHNILIFKNGKVYVWGRNYEGQLCLGNTKNRKTPTENTQLEQIIRDNGGTNNILTLETSAHHNILIFKNGKAYVWGYNKYGQLGLGDRRKRKIPTENTYLEQIIQENGGARNIYNIYFIGSSAILIFKNGTTYVWGYNDDGQLGLGDRWIEATPTENSKLEQIIRDNGGTDNILTLETGKNHNILIFKNGKVYVWGRNYEGQLGLGVLTIHIPTRNFQLEQIIKDNGGTENILTLETGGDHNILIFKNGKVYVWGYNLFGQLGLGDNTNRNMPTENSKLEQIIQENGCADNILTLETGASHNVLIFKNGKVYVWGYNDDGQLGLGYRSTSSPYGILTPTENTILEQIIQENDGVDNILTLKTGGEHNILIFKNGKVYVWGANNGVYMWDYNDGVYVGGYNDVIYVRDYNSYGQLGLGDTTNRNTPTENTQLEQIIQDNGGVNNILTLETGAIHNILIFKNRKVYVWGGNNYGQLGLGDWDRRDTPTENTQLEQIIHKNGGVFLGGGSSVV